MTAVYRYILGEVGEKAINAAEEQIAVLCEELDVKNGNMPKEEPATEAAE